MSQDPQNEIKLPKVKAISSVFVTAHCPECNQPRDILHDVSLVLDKDFTAKNLEIQVQCNKCYTFFEVTEVVNS
jgi:carbamate kinase